MTVDPLQNALIRGVLIGLVTGAIALLTALQQGDDTRQAVIIGLLSFLGVVLARGLGEGSYDQRSTIQRTADASKKAASGG